MANLWWQLQETNGARTGADRRLRLQAATCPATGQERTVAKVSKGTIVQTSFQTARRQFICRQGIPYQGLNSLGKLPWNTPSKGSRVNLLAGESRSVG